METKITKKFSTIYTVVNVLFWAYIVLSILVVSTLAFVFFAGWLWQTFMDEIWIILKTPQLFLFAISIMFVWFIGFFINFYLLYLARKISFNLKNGKIFTEENAKIIRILFIIFAIFFIIAGIIFSWGFISVLACIFCWILYEIFFIWFDYKKENEKLEEENNYVI